MAASHRNVVLASRLADLAARLSGRPVSEVERLTATLLALAPGPTPQRGRTTLNSNGTLLQVCLSARPAGWSARLIGDPATDCADPAQRHDRACAALAALLRLAGAEGLEDAGLLALRHLLSGELADYRVGTLWLAASLSQPGIAVYLDARPPGPGAAWEMARRWVGLALPDPRPALAAIDSLALFATPASFGIEGSTPADGRAKLYFRLGAPRALTAWGVPLFARDPFSQFLTLAMGDRTIRDTGLVASLSFSLASGALVDGKIDLCGCTDCLAYGASGWVDLVERLTRHFGLAPLPLAQALADETVEVAFLGCGLSAGGAPRLNVYLKSAPRRLPSDAAGTSAALADAIDFLTVAQEVDGRWVDYHLPVGSADQWVTAYVGLALAEAGADAPARRAAHWLASHRSYPAGWGYNARTGPDADSTAFAVRLHHVLGLPVRPADQAFLRGLWQRGGGFATYARADAWGLAHPDVTPMAYLGLAHDDRASLVAELLEAVRRWRRHDGLWPSYWWRRPFLGSFLMLDMLHELGLEETWLPEPAAGSTYEADDAFNLAALLGIELLRGRAVMPLLGALLARQRSDGSWDGAPNLRVTDPECVEPWKEPRGELYTDTRRTITTATAVRVLARLETMSTAGAEAPPARAPGAQPAPNGREKLV